MAEYLLYDVLVLGFGAVSIERRKANLMIPSGFYLFHPGLYVTHSTASPMISFVKLLGAMSIQFRFHLLFASKKRAVLCMQLQSLLLSPPRLMY